MSAPGRAAPDTGAARVRTQPQRSRACRRGIMRGPCRAPRHAGSLRVMAGRSGKTGMGKTGMALRVIADFHGPFRLLTEIKACPAGMSDNESQGIAQPFAAIRRGRTCVEERHEH